MPKYKSTHATLVKFSATVVGLVILALVLQGIYLKWEQIMPTQSDNYHVAIPDGQIVWLEGNVEYAPEDTSCSCTLATAKNWRNLTPDEKVDLNSGNFIRTGDDARVEVVLSNGVIFRLAENTAVRTTWLAYDNFYLLEQYYGKSYHRLPEVTDTDIAQTYHVQAGMAQLTADGTAFNVVVEEDKMVQVDALDKTVYFDPVGYNNKVKLTEGEKVTYDLSSQNYTKGQVDIAKIKNDEWISLNEKKDLARGYKISLLSSDDATDNENK